MDEPLEAPLQVFVEYRADEEWRLLGTYHAAADGRMLRLLGVVPVKDPKPVVPMRGLPTSCAFETWLAHMEPRTPAAKLGPEEMGRLRLARLIGADVDHLVVPSRKARYSSWASAKEVARVLKAYARWRRGGPCDLAPAWKALLELVQPLPEGRIVFVFDG